MNGLHFVRYKRPSKIPRWYIYAWRGGPRLWKLDSIKKPYLRSEDVDKLFKAAGLAATRQCRATGAECQTGRAS